MTPSNTILDAIANRIATDAATLAPATLALKVKLAKAPFTPDPALDVSTLTEADFAGYGAIDAGLGACAEFVDPSNLLRVVELNTPVGGWHWQTSGTTHLPQTIYGFYVTDNAGTVLMGSALITPPITLNASGQGFDLATIRLTFQTGSPS